MRTISTVVNKNNDLGDIEIIEDEKCFRVYNNKYGVNLTTLVGDISYEVKDDIIFITQKVHKKGKKDLTYLTIIDREDSSVLADKWVVSEKVDGIYLLYDSNAKELDDGFVHGYHILDTNKMDFYEFGWSYVDAKFLGYHCGNPMFSLDLGSLKRIYNKKYGFYPKEQKKDYELVGNTLVITDENGSKKFTVMSNAMVNLKDPGSHKTTRIVADPNDKNIIYCHADESDEVYAYYVTEDKCIKLFESSCVYIEKVDEIRDLRYSYERLYTFQKTYESGRLGLTRTLINFNNDKAQSSDALNYERYSTITKKEKQHDYEAAYDLEFANKYGMCKIDMSNNTILECEYDKITQLTSDYYLLEKNGVSFIYDFEKDKMCYEYMRIKEKYDDAYIFEKGTKEGIMFVQDDDITILDGYDYVQEEDGFFHVCRNDQWGIVKDGQEIIKPQYDEVTIELINVGKYNSSYFTGTNLDGSNELLKYCKANGLENIPTKNYKSYQFPYNFLVFNDKKNKHIYSLDYKLLKTVPLETEIKAVRVDENDNVTMLKLGDELFKYDNGKLEEISQDKIYTRVYESKYGYVVVNEYEWGEFQESTEELDNMSPNAFETELYKMYSSRLDIQEKYPELKRKK